ncbi:MAG TPA: YbaB/EbfC family nucleoid-associated protein [Robiginitalea sp.]|nr:YbaB/EbfC family nucleoid-associated protein [Robiginitalea sp.]
MFGDLMGMMGKLRETQEKIKATKERLSTVTIAEKSPDGLLEAVVSANRELVEIKLDDRLLADKEQLIDSLIGTLNQALARAGEVHEAELGAVAREGMPNLPGMDQLFK